jgi:hypothetical protein
MGTTLHAMEAIARFLQLPAICLPVTTLVVGYPDEAPPRRDRLPARALMHEETYARPSGEDLDRIYAKREADGWNRYLSTPHIKALIEQHGIRSLPEFYTSRVKYDPELFQRDSDTLKMLLSRRRLSDSAPPLTPT